MSQGLQFACQISTFGLYELQNMLLFSPKSRVNNIQNVKYAKLGSSHSQSVSFRINGRCYVSCVNSATVNWNATSGGIFVVCALEGEFQLNWKWAPHNNRCAHSQLNNPNCNGRRQLLSCGFVTDFLLFLLSRLHCCYCCCCCCRCCRCCCCGGRSASRNVGLTHPAGDALI